MQALQYIYNIIRPSSVQLMFNCVKSHHEGVVTLFIPISDRQIISSRSFVPMLTCSAGQLKNKQNGQQSC